MKKIIAAIAISVIALTTAACSDPEYGSQYSNANNGYVGVCTDQNGNRVADNQCQSSPAMAPAGYNGGGYYGQNHMLEDFMWFYMLSNMTMPRMGTQVVHNHYYSGAGTYHPSSGYNLYRGGVPSTGGRVNFNNYSPRSYSINSNGRMVSGSGSSFRSVSGYRSGTINNSYGRSGSGSSYRGSIGGYSRSGGSSGGFRSSSRR